MIQTASNPDFISSATPIDVDLLVEDEVPVELASVERRKVQTALVVSFFLFAMSVSCDWLLTYHIGKGRLTTFDLHDWLIFSLVGFCTFGSFATFLLLYSCFEQFVQHAEPDDLTFEVGGCRLICRQLMGWLKNFDVFRISFLILVFEDIPVSFYNFWLISACNIPRGQLPVATQFWANWPQTICCCAKIFVSIWRFYLIFLALRRIRVVKTPSQLFTQHPPVKSASGHSIKTLLIARGHSIRATQYDECWPARVSTWISCPPSDLEGEEGLPEDNCGKFLQTTCCCSICCLLSLLLCTSCFVPCLYHYSCRRNASSHRERFARTCVRVTGFVHHVVVVVLSCVCLLFALVVNSVWLCSDQGMGTHRLAPGIYHSCLYADGFDLKVDFLYQPNSQPLENCGYPVVCVDLTAYLHHADLKLPMEMRDFPNGTLHLRYQSNVDSVNRQDLSYIFGFRSHKRCLAKRGSSTQPCDQANLRWPYFSGCKVATPRLDPTIPLKFCNVSFLAEDD